jgi:hypothetical protein
MSESVTLHGLLLKFVQVFMVQTAHTAIANARAHIDRRLARWILMAHDRTGDKALPLTHEFLALMLTTRTSSSCSKVFKRSTKSRTNAGPIRITGGLSNVAKRTPESILALIV